ncbi:MAG: hypothetical protein R2764_21360 [Bacteroidales bacterium]
MGIGVLLPTEKLEVNGNIKQAIGYSVLTDKVQASGTSGLKLYNNSGDGIFVSPGGNVGIGTQLALNKLEVNGTVKATAFTGDGSGLTNTDDGDWIVNSNNVYRQNGNVGIGTTSPQVRLHIEDNAGSYNTEFLKISNDNTYAGGSISLGKWGGNGPLILQKGGNIPFANNNNYPRLAFIQRATNGDDGLDISTFADSLGAVMNAVIKAPNSDLFIFSQEDIVLGTDFGEAEHVYFKANGNVGIGKASPGAKLDVNGSANIDGTLEAEDIEVTGTLHTNVLEAEIFDIEQLEVSNLYVTEKLWAGEIEVIDITEWKDCVFENNYDLMSLKETEAFIKEHKHLPGIPSEKEVLENGINVGEMNALLLQKIEELTLYVIELEKKLNNYDEK